jgi:AcrR family transcriptional regulator
MAHWKNASQTNDEISRLKRDAIIREAGRIFSRDGFHNASLDEVARVLDVSKGTLYNYVRDKQEILFECHKLALSVAQRAFEACSPSDSGAERLRTVLTTYATAISEELGACGIINETGALREQDRRFVKAGRRKLNSRLVAIVEDGVQDGSLRRVDAKLAVFTVVGAVHAIPSWCLEQTMEPEAVVAGLVTRNHFHALLRFSGNACGSARKDPRAPSHHRCVYRKTRQGWRVI